MSSDDTVQRVLDYHRRTKHHVHRYARSLGYLDWAQQPKPFRRYEGAPLIPLMHPPVPKKPYYDELFEAGAIPAAPLDLENLSRLFYDSLAISAWKQIQGAPPWSLRVNPSSGDLHPTEAYLVCGPVAGLFREPGVFHYGVFNHALERRYFLTESEWGSVAAQLPPGAALIALSSIYWREAWKYGERAFRYCHHDVGHAIGTITFGAATLGWRGRIIQNVSDEELECLLGLCFEKGPETEQADCLIAIFPDRALDDSDPMVLRLPRELLARLRETGAMGRPNALSAAHHSWPIIDEVATLTRHPRMENPMHTPCEGLEAQASILAKRPISARQLIRTRRSAVRMDGHTRMAEEIFYHIMARTRPATRPFRVLPWPPRVSLALFVHRVCGLPSGLYVLARAPEHVALLRAAMHDDFSWQRPERCPPRLNLFQLLAGDARQAAEIISCHQSIAGDGAFSLGMLADFDAMVQTRSPWAYPRLFWETGLIGQVLYLEAEAAGLQATGIGCFFDDAMHELLGLADPRWQSLYHFTIGGAVWDERLQTLAAYHHLEHGPS